MHAQSALRRDTTRPAKIRSILVVDDDATQALGISLLLKKLGFETETANGGRLALKALDCGQFDLVITDLYMDDMEGLETIMAIRGQYAGMHLIAVSGGSRLVGVDCLEMAFFLGADTILRKPLGIDELVRAIYELENKHSPTP